MKRYLIIGTGILSVIYLINPTAGLFELIPDNLPFVGNLDEGAAAYVLISVVAYLTGKDFGLFNKKQEATKGENEELLEEDRAKENG